MTKLKPMEPGDVTCAAFALPNELTWGTYKIGKHGSRTTYVGYEYPVANLRKIESYQHIVNIVFHLTTKTWATADVVNEVIRVIAEQTKLPVTGFVP